MGDAEADAAGRAGDDGRFLHEHGRLLVREGVD
jgi:hypothetical protein